jgi:lipid II:glycine glycyltransferase (peptidoglycan interpeptide bridge formation enzyme)
MTKPKFELDSEYTYSIDSANEQEWNDIIRLFRDAVYNQTWAWCHVMSKETSHLILRRNGRVVAAAMLRLIILPIINAGIAYIGSGPMWRLRDGGNDLDALRNLLRALRTEYASRRGLFLRISPNVFSNIQEHIAICSLFQEEGFVQKNKNKTTLFLDLKPTVEDLRKGLNHKWRNQLNHAEKNGFTVYEGTGIDLFNKFKSIYYEMLDRKKFQTTVDLDKYEAIQIALPQDLKPRIVICELDGRPMSSAVFSISGETANCMLFASSNEGTKNRASYLVQWQIINLLKERGFYQYDLGGCNPNTVKGTYQFKAGICGKKPELSSQIGIMETCDSSISRCVVYTGEFLQSFSFTKKITGKSKN